MNRLVGGATLPESSAVSGSGSRAVVPALNLAITVLPLTSAGAASDEDQNGGNKRKDSSSQDTPGSGAVVGGAVVVAVPANPPSDDAEGDKVTYNCDGCNNETQDGNERGQQRDENALAKREQESNEEEASSNSMENHDVGQGLGGGLGGIRESCAVSLTDDLGDVIADVRVAACVPIVAEEIIVTTPAPTKAAKIYMSIGTTAQVDPEDGKAVNDGS